MRKYRYLAMATGVALVLSVPAGAAVAASAHKALKPVLTIGKVGGTAVKKGAVLKASLPKGGSITFTSGSGSVSCTSSSIEARVLRNPVKAGEATVSVTSVSVSNCGTEDGVSLTFTPINPPYGGLVKVAKGDPVTVSEASKAKPLGFMVTAKDGSLEASCVLTAASLAGHASNKGNVVGFSKQTLTLDTSASSSACTLLKLTSATVTATYGPLVDSSVKHSPKVFVS
jgi:hypothetical protein